MTATSAASHCCCYGTSSSFAPTAYTDAVKMNAGSALDVVLIERSDGQLQSSDWLLVFDRLSHPFKVHIHVNGREISSCRMNASAPSQPATFEAGSCAPPAELLTELMSRSEVRPGKNELRYTVVESGQTVRAWLYLWPKQSRVVVFDVDGTVTLNDLVGQLGNVLNVSFVHKGVCELLCQLDARGYQLLFLTSRTLLGPAGIDRTRRYLFEVAHDAESGFRLPEAAVCTTRHTSTITALAHELGGASGAYKTNALKSLVSLAGRQQNTQACSPIPGRRPLLISCLHPPPSFQTHQGWRPAHSPAHSTRCSLRASNVAPHTPHAAA